MPSQKDAKFKAWSVRLVHTTFLGVLEQSSMLMPLQLQRNFAKTDCMLAHGLLNSVLSLSAVVVSYLWPESYET